MEFTTEDIVEIFNQAGFETIEAAVQALSVAKAFIEAGFTGPTIFTPAIKRFKLLDEQMKLKSQAATLQADQQRQVQQLIETTNPPIGELNNQIAAIDMELAKLQV